MNYYYPHSHLPYCRTKHSTYNTTQVVLSNTQPLANPAKNLMKTVVHRGEPISRATDVVAGSIERADTDSHDQIFVALAVPQSTG